jgi:hypothetical protein
MKKPILIICVPLVAVHDIHPQQNGFPKLTGPYLGQKQPGMTPEPFAEYVREGHTVLHSGIVFSPDGKYLFFLALGKPYWISTKIIEALTRLNPSNRDN